VEAAQVTPQVKARYDRVDRLFEELLAREPMSLQEFEEGMAAIRVELKAVVAIAVMEAYP
jgi:hypothetical protein